MPETLLRSSRIEPEIIARQAVKILDSGTGNIFVVSLDSFVVDGDNKRAGVGVENPEAPFQVQTEEDLVSTLVAIFEGNRPTAFDNDESYISFRLSDSGQNQEEVARYTWKLLDATDTNEDGEFSLSVINGGSLEEKLRVGGDGVLRFNDEYSFPNVAGSTGQVLKLNGSGDLEFQDDVTGNRPSVSDNGVEISPDPTDINFIGDFVVIDDSDGTVTVSGTGTVKDTFTLVGDGNTDEFTVNHNRSTRNLIVQVREDFGDFELVDVGIRFDSLNSIIVSFNPPPANGENHIVNIIG